MRLNKFVASASDLSRRAADSAIQAGRVNINGSPASLGDNVSETDVVMLDGKTLVPQTEKTILLLNKPVGYVCSRRGQGSETVYSFLPKQYQHLETVGRLDKDSSGLLVLTNDGKLANQLTHPSYEKEKTYEVVLDKPLSPSDLVKLNKGVMLFDGISKLGVKPLETQNSYLVTMSEGRNRQIRRTFDEIGYQVRKLHRTKFGSYKLARLKPGEFIVVEP